MRLDEFFVALRSAGTRALFDFAECFEADIARPAGGTPLDFNFSDQQTAEAMRAIETLRSIVSAPDLVPNSRALAGRLRQGIVKSPRAAGKQRGSHVVLIPESPARHREGPWRATTTPRAAR